MSKKMQKNAVFSKKSATCIFFDISVDKSSTNAMAMRKTDDE